MDFLQNTFLLNLYSLAAFLFLLFAIILQRARLQRMEKELDHITRHYQLQASAPKSVRDELLEACPYPICVVDLKGGILFSNRHFAELTPDPVKNLQEFDHFTGSEMGHFPLVLKRHSYRLVTLRRHTNNSTLRQFNVIAWPVETRGNQVGTVLSFHEQTHALRRKAQQFRFEQQLVSYLAHLAIRLDGVSAKDLPLIEEYGKEVHLLTASMQQIHAQVRQPNVHASLDSIRLLREVTQEYRNEARTKQIQIISTLPKEQLVIAHYNDLELIFRSVTAAIFLLAGPQSVIRQQTHHLKSHFVIEWILPEQKTAEKEAEQAFAFGVMDDKLNTNQRLWRLDLAIAREIAAKYNGHLAVVSLGDLGTAYRLTLVVAGEE